MHFARLTPAKPTHDQGSLNPPHDPEQGTQAQQALVLNAFAAVKELNELIAAPPTDQTLLQVGIITNGLRNDLDALMRAGLFEFITPLECLLSERMPGRIALCALLLQAHPQYKTRAVRYRLQSLIEAVPLALKSELEKCL
jgi:hypothetical protein